MLSDDISRYIELRRSLGFKVRLAACLLRRYAEFAEARGKTVVQSRLGPWWTGRHRRPQLRSAVNA
jgi:hypothetical protein